MAFRSKNLLSVVLSALVLTVSSVALATPPGKVDLSEQCQHYMDQTHKSIDEGNKILSETLDTLKNKSRSLQTAAGRARVLGNIRASVEANHKDFFLEIRDQVRGASIAEGGESYLVVEICLPGMSDPHYDDSPTEGCGWVAYSKTGENNILNIADEYPGFNFIAYVVGSQHPECRIK